MPTTVTEIIAVFKILCMVGWRRQLATPIQWLNTIDFFCGATRNLGSTPANQTIAALKKVNITRALLCESIVENWSSKIHITHRSLGDHLADII